MLTELANPILKMGATVSLTVSKESDTTLRVVVIPTTPANVQASHEALSQPLFIVDTPENLDRNLGRQLAEYTEARQDCINTLEEATKLLKETKTTTARKTAEAIEKKAKEKQAAAKAEKTGATTEETKQADLALANPQPQSQPVATT